jgi:hypothetical protein
MPCDSIPSERGEGHLTADHEVHEIGLVLTGYSRGHTGLESARATLPAKCFSAATYWIFPLSREVRCAKTLQAHLYASCPTLL